MRQRRTKEETAQLELQIMEVLLEDYPQSVRHVFYRMTNPRLTTPVVKSDHGYKQVQQRISRMRRSSDLPYGWITDATRRGYHVNTFTSASDFLEQMKSYYRADLWSDNESYVEVWCESRSLAGVIEDTCREYAVSLYPAGGFSSMTLIYDAAQYINDVCVDRRDAYVIYIGDYDPAGVLIDKSIESDLRKHLDPSVPLEFIRLGITLEQIELYDLPTKPRKSGDKRSQQVTTTVEADAMPANLMRSLLANEIEEFLPEDAFEKVLVAEESELQALDLVAYQLRRASA